MPDTWITAAGAVVSCLGIVLMQRLALRLLSRDKNIRKPQGLPQRLGSKAGDLIALLVGAQLYALFFLVTARPLTGAVLTLATGLLLLALNRVKETILHEPLVLADAWLLPQLFRHPGLYVPFLPVKRLAAGLFALACCLAALAWLERPPPGPRSACGPLLLGAIFLLPCCLLLLLARGHLAKLGGLLLRHCPVSHDAVADALACGHLASALAHPALTGRMKRQGRDFLACPHTRPKESAWPENFEEFLFSVSGAESGRLPHVALIQAESFCDIRPLLPQAQRDALMHFLPNWDALTALQRTFPAPEHAFGAYTMRTEFAMLTGLGAQALGPWAFNPYILAAERPLWSLARHFGRQGYRSLCIHPYDRRFFSRDKVMPLLGFHEFRAMPELARLERFGPHISDAALGREVVDTLRRSARPVFCFVITMEAHGPWLAGRLTDDQIATTLSDIRYEIFSKQLQMYLCHLRHMDSLFGMIHRISDRKISSERECSVWIYSDHMPNLII